MRRRIQLEAVQIQRVAFEERGSVELAHMARPVVLTGSPLAQWGAAHWTPQSLARDFGGAPVRARFHAARTCGAEDDDETEGLELELTMRAFCEWLEGGASASAPALAGLPAGCTGYVSYQRFARVFGRDARALGAVGWRSLGLDADAEGSTFWLGSKGAHTPCHQDSYGANIVAQLFGTKRWALYPPSAAFTLNPTRVPYEESSVFSRASRAELLTVAGRVEVDLNPGELLVVPKRWWHTVETRSHASISVNQWLPLPDDPTDRAREALVRLVACALLPLAAPAARAAHGGAARDVAPAAAGAAPSTPAHDPPRPVPRPVPQPSPWLNLGEEVWPAGESLHALAAALEEEGARGGRACRQELAGLAMRDVVDALCTGPALDAALTALRRARAPLRHSAPPDAPQTSTAAEIQSDSGDATTVADAVSQTKRRRL